MRSLWFQFSEAVNVAVVSVMPLRALKAIEQPTVRNREEPPAAAGRRAGHVAPRWVGAKCAGGDTGLNIEVQVKLVGVGAKADLVHLALALVLDPGGDQVFGEDAAFEKEFVVRLERIEHGVE